jgi:2-polyprenyl-6-methoxyphenol hydroxylase-like FAD-dependent oxidoreductase
MYGNELRVCIIGAGTGGLCLAHGLKQDGLSSRGERDHVPSDRPQGYRLSISTVGRRALKECLPQRLFQKLIKYGAKASESVTFLDHHLDRLLVVNLPHSDRENADSELPVSRVALRHILSEELDGVIHYGKKFVAFENVPRGAVSARFEDGTSATGGVLIGADGASSWVRGQLLPSAKRLETGITAVSGKLSLSEEVRQATPAPILRGPTLILGPGGCFMFASTVDYEDGAASGEEPYDREKYVMWGFSAHRDALGLSAELSAVDPQLATDAVIALMDDWHPVLRGLVRGADPSTITAFAVKTSVPIPPWATRRVTLLGDALHNMTPFRGIGANTALRDAAALRRALAAVVRGDADLLDALAAYERGMIRYGFAAVQASLKNMERFHAAGRLARTMVKSLFRVIDHVPPLKPMFLGR